jgi:hypothetical protein
MRYRLRTLMMLLAMSGVVLARVAYLKRCRDWHREEVARIIAAIAVSDGGDNKIAFRSDGAANDLARASRLILPIVGP